MKICALFLALFLVPQVLFGQDTAPTAQERQASKWVEQYHEWAKMYENHAHKERKKLKPPPAVPVWLSAVCEAEGVPAGPITEACKLLEEISSTDPVALEISRGIAAARTKGEEREHSSFLELVHIDFGWMRSGSYQRGQGIFGLVGMHLAIPVPGARRVQLYIPPGVLLMNLPDGRGGRNTSLGTSMGVSFRVFSFRLMNRPMVAHANIAKVWIMMRPPGAASVVAPGRQSVDMAGLSFSFKK